MEKNAVILYQAHAVKLGVIATAALASNVLVGRRFPRALRWPCGSLTSPVFMTGRPGAMSLEDGQRKFHLLRPAGETIMACGMGRHGPELLSAGQGPVFLAGREGY